MGISGPEGDAVCDAAREHSGLSGTRARDHGDKMGRRGDRGALIGVEIGDQGVGVHAVTLRDDARSDSAGHSALVTGGPGGDYAGAMPYPKKFLNDYETVAVDLHPHWWYFSEPVGALIGSIILGICTLVFTSGTGGARTGLVWLVILMIVLSAAWVVVRYLKWMTTNFVITSDRLIFRSGVIAKIGVEIPLERVNTVHFSQSIFERMTGAGDLVIESGGEDGQQRFTDIRRPDRVQKQIHSQMEVNEKRRFTITSPTSSADVATQLEKLEGMLERGTLTEEEFQSQKDKLLGS